MKVPQSLRECRGTAAVDELHIDAIDDIRVLSNPIEAIRYKPNFYIIETTFSSTDHMYMIHKNENFISFLGLILMVVLTI